MAEKANITRRAAFVGAIASTAALAVPAVAAVSKGDELHAFLDAASPDDLVQYHAAKLAEALCKSRPGLWRFSLASVHSDQCGGVVMFHRRESATFNGYAQDFK